MKKTHIWRTSKASCGLYGWPFKCRRRGYEKYIRGFDFNDEDYTD
jgi:hypothetical protein